MNRALPPTRNPSGTAKTGWLHRLTETGKAHLPTSAPLRARASRSLSGQLYEHHPGGDPALRHPLSCCLSATGIRFLGTLSRQGLPPLLRSAYRPACTYPCLPDGP
jgi:hypothetical protein